MISSQIHKAMKSVWKKAEVEGAQSCTFRKSAVSSVQSSSDSNDTDHNSRGKWCS